MIIEINSDSDVWLAVKHSLRAAGYRWALQNQLFDSGRVSLFLEPQTEPEGGKLVNGLLVYDGGAKIDSAIQRIYEQEIENKY